MWVGLLLTLLSLSAGGALQDEPCRLGQELWASGRRLEALEVLQEALEAAPGDRELRLCLAARRVEVHRYAAALEALEGVEGASARPLRARSLWMLGRYGEALEHLDPADPEEGLLVVHGHLRLGQLEQADAELERLARLLGEQDPAVRLLRARRLAREGRDGAAAELLEPLHRADPFDPEVLFLLGQSLARSGRRERGVELLERHRRLAPLMDELEFARRGVDLEPLHAPGHARIGDVERAIGRLDRAEAAYRRALELASDEERTPVALRLARLLHEDRGDLAGALACLDAALGRVRDVRLLVRAGDYLAAAGEEERARAAYRAGLELRPGDEAILARLRELGDG